jgi:hypothetical protein
MNGSLLRLYVDGVAVAYSTSDTLDLTRAMRELAHKDNTSAWVEVSPGQKSATFSTELMFADIGDASANTKFNTLFSSWDSGTSILGSAGYPVPAFTKTAGAVTNQRLPNRPAHRGDVTFCSTPVTPAFPAVGASGLYQTPRCARYALEITGTSFSSFA